MASFKHIKLTQEEALTAIINAKRQKAEVLREQKMRDREAANRLLFMNCVWDYEKTREWMLLRAKVIFAKKTKGFVLDKHNEAIFNLLCYYFSNDPLFVAHAEKLGVKNASLDKGILLCGPPGVGKSWMMLLFARNKRQSFDVHSAKRISDRYEAEGVTAVTPFYEIPRNAFNDPEVFYQPSLGFCFDDIGTESIVVNFGNRRSVIQDIFEVRYSKNRMGPWVHATSNLTAKAIGELYGPRVHSRLREVINLIELPGTDRRV